MAQRNVTGMFPRAIMERFPLLPLEEEGRLNDMPLRENFVGQVLPVAEGATGPTTAGPGCWTRRRRPAVSSSSTPHTSSPSWPTAHPDPWSGHYPEMGRLVAEAGKRDWDELIAEYGAMLMESLGVRCPELAEGMGTRGKHVNVLQHLMGYLKNHLSSEDKAYLR